MQINETWRAWPKEMPVICGKDLLKPKVKGGKAAICKLYKKDDMEGGICVYREKFNVVFVSKHSPKTYEKELSHSLPLQRMNVIYLKVDPENRGWFFCGHMCNKNDIALCC